MRNPSFTHRHRRRAPAARSAACRLRARPARRRWPRRPRSISPKYFYDARGSALFDRICELPEYYPTRTELRILHATAPPRSPRRSGRGAEIVEFGAGSLTQGAPAARRAASAARATCRSTSRASTCEGAAARLRARLSRRWTCSRVVADYTQPLRAARAGCRARASASASFPGSTIGNFTPGRGAGLPAAAPRACCAAAALLLGVDLVKDPARAARRLQRRAGRDGGLQPQPAGARQPRAGRRLRRWTHFTHCAFYNAPLQRIEMHLVSRRAQAVTLAGRALRLRRRRDACTPRTRTSSPSTACARWRRRPASAPARCGPTATACSACTGCTRRGTIGAAPDGDTDMKATWNGAIIAESDDTVVVEGNHYFPDELAQPRLRHLQQPQDQLPLEGPGQLLLAAGQRRTEPRRRLVLRRPEARGRRWSRTASRSGRA